MIKRISDNGHIADLIERLEAAVSTIVDLRVDPDALALERASAAAIAALRRYVEHATQVTK